MLLVIWTVVTLVTLLIELVPGSPATTILGETATPNRSKILIKSTGSIVRHSFFPSAAKAGSHGTA